MISLKKITKFELQNLVEIAYKGDVELLDKYWGDGYSLEEAVGATMDAINKLDSDVEISYYSVILDEEEIGYVCKFQNNLYSFSININHRTKDNLIEFWERIKEVMEDSFICMLYPQNSRAVNWLERCGMVKVEGVEENCVIMLNIN